MGLSRIPPDGPDAPRAPQGHHKGTRGTSGHSESPATNMQPTWPGLRRDALSTNHLGFATLPLGFPACQDRGTPSTDSAPAADGLASSCMAAGYSTVYCGSVLDDALRCWNHLHMLPALLLASPCFLDSAPRSALTFDCGRSLFMPASASTQTFFQASSPPSVYGGPFLKQTCLTARVPPFVLIASLLLLYPRCRAPRRLPAQSTYSH